MLVAKLAGLYDADHRAMRHLTVDEAPAICAWGVVGTVAVSLLGELTPAGALDTKDLALVILAAVAADFALRVAARAIWRATTPPSVSLIVGGGSLAHSMRRKFTLFGDLHMEAIENGHGGGGIDRVVLAHERIDAVQIAAIADLCNSTRRSSASFRRCAGRRPRMRSPDSPSCRSSSTTPPTSRARR